MLSRLGRKTLWKYADDVSIERLHRHHRIASRICLIGFGSGLWMATSLAEFMAGGPDGWMGTVRLVVLLCSCGTSLLMIIPAIIGWAWGSEIEREFTNRGLPLPDGGRMRDSLPGTAMKMCYWFIAVGVIAHFAQG